MEKWPSLLIIVIFISSGSEALKCYVCKTRENSQCFDISESYIKAEECTGRLKWNEKYACLMNSSMENNLIITDRNCVTTNHSSNFCEGHVSPNKFGTCKLCYDDECNKENYNGTNRLMINVKILIFLSGILFMLRE